MQLFRWALVACAVVALAGCGESRFQTYNGPEVTQVVVQKENRRMYLMHHDRVLKSFDIDLGFEPTGHKRLRGDGRTPEGHYFIDRRNPNSAFHLSIGISYPNEKDLAEALLQGADPGGDIFIHGWPNGRKVTERDWTYGCIAVNDRQMQEIYAMVRDGTPISIYR